MIGDEQRISLADFDEDSIFIFSPTRFRAVMGQPAGDGTWNVSVSIL
jgi:hypothetical protein